MPADLPESRAAVFVLSRLRVVVGATWFVNRLSDLERKAALCTSDLSGPSAGHVQFTNSPGVLLTGRSHLHRDSIGLEVDLTTSLALPFSRHSASVRQGWHRDLYAAKLLVLLDRHFLDSNENRASECVLLSNQSPEGL